VYLFYNEGLVFVRQERVHGDQRVPVDDSENILRIYVIGRFYLDKDVAELSEEPAVRVLDG
jgi:hypothetical protein